MKALRECASCQVHGEYDDSADLGYGLMGIPAGWLYAIVCNKAARARESTQTEIVTCSWICLAAVATARVTLGKEDL